MIIEFIVAKSGNILNLENINLPEKEIILTENFEQSKVLGFCKLYKEGNVLKAKADVPSSMIDMFPAISLRYKRNDNTINHLKIDEVSLCKTENVDKSIKKISEQLLES